MSDYSDEEIDDVFDRSEEETYEVSISPVMSSPHVTIQYRAGR